MDKKNTTIGVALLLAAFASFYFSARFAPQPQAQQRKDAVVTASSTSAAPTATASNNTYATENPAAGSEVTITAVSRDDSAVETVKLSNETIEVEFTAAGGAIRDVALIAREKAKGGTTKLKYPAQVDRPEPFIFNELHVAPALSFAGVPGSYNDLPGLDAKTKYTLVSKTANQVSYQTSLPNGVVVTRTYTLSTGTDENWDPYQIRHEITFKNPSDQVQLLPQQKFALNLGTVAPANANDPGTNLNVGYYDGAKDKYIIRTQLEGGSFLGFNRHEPVSYLRQPETAAANGIVWASVKNQFFAAILTPDEPALSVVIRRVELPPFQGSLTPAVGITGTAEFEAKPLAPKSETKIGFNYYVGPKEYRRLANIAHFKHDEDKVVQFSSFKIFSFFSKTLLWLMTSVHGLVSNWGFAIILSTLLLRAVLMPFSLAAARSSKRMAKLQPQMAIIKEKYKDNPQKQQAATMELFKENRVNPVGGCIPIFITIPFFIGFWGALQTAPEFRFEPFLWVRDLSAPDTVGHILGFPINIMPLLMGATMLLQVQLAPQPTVDNSQAKMFKFMPLMFMVFFYNYSSALALYSTVGNVFTIVQQLIINRLPDPVPNPLPGVKNVTPSKKKKK